MNLINARVGFQRIQKFVDSEEMDPGAIRGPAAGLPGNGAAAVTLSGASFAWDPTKDPVLKVRGGIAFCSMLWTSLSAAVDRHASDPMRGGALRGFVYDERMQRDCGWRQHGGFAVN